MRNPTKVGIFLLATTSVIVFIAHSSKAPFVTRSVEPQIRSAHNLITSASTDALVSVAAAPQGATTPAPQDQVETAQPARVTTAQVSSPMDTPNDTTPVSGTVANNSSVAASLMNPNAVPAVATTPNIPLTQPAPGTLTEIVPGGWYANSDPSSLQQSVLMPASSWPGNSTTASIGAHTMILVLDPESSSPSLSAVYNTPAQLQTAYSLPSTGGSGVIAIVDAYHDANALNDFNTFSKYFGFPQETSTVATASTNKVFQQVYATGTAPVNNTIAADDCLGWVIEISLDIEYAHALAPGAKIVLVEANSSAWNDLLKGIQVANALPGVKEVSMSFGSQEFSGENTLDSYFTTTGVTYFAGGGDASSASSYPAHSPNVIGVGGTTLNRNSTGVLQSETVWNMTGFGLSAFETRPSYQGAISTQLGSKRGGNDVAFLGNPNTGVYIYNSTAYDGMVGWYIIGGTSVGSPCWAAIANQAGTDNGFPTNSQGELTRLYANLGNNVTFRDVTSGTSGTASAGFGWDLPTGLGSPIGLVGK